MWHAVRKMDFGFLPSVKKDEAKEESVVVVGGQSSLTYDGGESAFILVLTSTPRHSLPFPPSHTVQQVIEVTELSDARHIVTWDLIPCDLALQIRDLIPCTCFAQF